MIQKEVILSIIVCYIFSWYEITGVNGALDKKLNLKGKSAFRIFDLLAQFWVFFIRVCLERKTSTYFIPYPIAFSPYLSLNGYFQMIAKDDSQRRVTMYKPTIIFFIELGKAVFFSQKREKLISCLKKFLREKERTYLKLNFEGNKSKFQERLRVFLRIAAVLATERCN